MGCLTISIVGMVLRWDMIFYGSACYILAQNRVGRV